MKDPTAIIIAAAIALIVFGSAAIVAGLWVDSVQPNVRVR
jgi:hypothetical protein